MPEEIECCPNPQCESPSIETRHRNSIHSPTDGPAYRCSDCQAKFDEPRVRERRGQYHHQGSQAALLKADPEEVLGE